MIAASKAPEMDSQASPQPDEAERYQKRVTEYCKWNPGLQHLDDFLRSENSGENNSRVSCLDVLQGTGCAKEPRHISSTELANLLRHPHTERSELLGQILIVE